MTDFHQNGFITTLHALYEAFDREEYLCRLESKLEEYSHHQRISLLLPCLYSELENTPVMDRILREIQKVRYLRSVVVALEGAQKETQFREVEDYFKRLRTSNRDVKVLWVGGPRIKQILLEVQRRGIPTGIQGKGQSVWVALGYLFAQEDSDVIAVHDCDIVTYDRILLGRLIEPTANPNNDYEFCKGYYPRISLSERAMRGRVTRLFVTPFVDAMVHLMHQRRFQELEQFFGYHRAFKYPLSGELSFTARLARGINIAYDWGLEIATLSEVYHSVIPRKIVQIDITQNYEHTHEAISPDDATTGLSKMVVDIAKFYLNYIVSHGVPLDDAFVDMIRHTYYQCASVFIKSYSEDAEVNGLAYDGYQEELAARYFGDFIWTAWEENKKQIKGARTLIPSWNQVLYSMPDIYSHLSEAVEKDNV